MEKKTVDFDEALFFIDAIMSGNARMHLAMRGLCKLGYPPRKLYPEFAAHRGDTVVRSEYKDRIKPVRDYLARIVEALDA